MKIYNSCSLQYKQPTPYLFYKNLLKKLMPLGWVLNQSYTSVSGLFSQTDIVVVHRYKYLMRYNLMPKGSQHKYTSIRESLISYTKGLAKEWFYLVTLNFCGHFKGLWFAYFCVLVPWPLWLCDELFTYILGGGKQNQKYKIGLLKDWKVMPIWMCIYLNPLDIYFVCL